MGIYKQFCPRGHDTWLVGRTAKHVCRLCERERSRRKAHTRREQANRRQRRWYQRHREQRIQQLRQQRRAKPLQLRLPLRRDKRRTDAAYRATHREKIRVYLQQYRLEHQEGLNTKDRLWRARNRLKVKEAKLRRRGIVLAAPGLSTPQQIAARLVYYGYRCWICGAPWEAIDHVKPLSKGGSNWPANLRPICLRCNRKKGNRWPYPLGN